MVFLYPTFLFGLLALAVPIIIHLVEMRRPQQMVFTNVSFLREVKQITASSRRLKRLLILLSRLLLLASLVLAFAQPFIPARNTQAGGDLDDVRIYLDNSMSMQNTSRTAAVSMLDEGKSQIRQLAMVFGPATRFRFLDNAFAGGQTGTSVAPMLNEIARLAVTPRRVGTGVAVGRLLNDVSTGSRPKVFVYSDFQRNTFDKQALEVGSKAADLYLMPLQAQSTRNVYVDTVSLRDEFVRANESNRLLVRVANSGGERANGINVKVFVDQQQVSTFSLDLDPGERKTTEVDFRVVGDGVKRSRVEVSDLPVTFDNTYYFVLRVAPQIRILGIGTTVETQAQKAFAVESAFHYVGTDERSLNYRTAAESDLILLQELPTISAGLSENVRKFVQTGGSVVVVPAGQSDKISYDTFFRELGLGNLRWLPTAPVPAQQFPLRVPDFRDPFFRGVFVQPDAAMAMPKAAPVLGWARSTVDVLSFRKGGAFLSGFQVGKGMVYVLAAPLAPAYSDFASHALFVPVLYKLAQQSYRASQQLAYSLGTRSVALPVRVADGRKEVFKLVRDDSTAFIPDQQVRDGQLIFSPPADMALAGFYTLRKPGEVPTVLAFNFDKHESDLAQYSVDELKQLVKDKPHVHLYEPGNSLTTMDRFRAENFGEPLWKYCVVAALAFLLAEVLLVRFL